MLNPIELRQRAASLREQVESIRRKPHLTYYDQERSEALLAEAEELMLDAREAERREGYTGPSKPVNVPMNYRANFGYGRTADEPKSIFFRWVRTGDEMAASELRAYNDVDMVAGEDPAGGVTVPTGMVQRIMARRDELMLATKLGVTRVPGKGTTVNFPIDNEADVIFNSVAEAAAIGQDSPALSEKAFTLVKYAKYITLSWELLRDTDVNLEEFLNNWTARGWAATHNNLLVTEVLANGTAGLTLDGAAAITAAEIPELVGKLMPEYRDNAAWLMNPSTFSFLQGLSSANQFLFSPTPGGDPQGSLWGYPLHQTSYMPAIAAGAKSMVFGNFNFVGYREGWEGLQMIRDIYSAATTGQVRLHFYFGAVYGVLQAEAIQLATQPTA